MRQRSAWMRLNRDTRKIERPRLAETIANHLGTVAAAGRAEETALGFQSIRRSGKAERRKLGRDNTAFSRSAGMKRLGHRAEIFAQSRSLRRADAQCAARRFAIETEQLC